MYHDPEIDYSPLLTAYTLMVQENNCFVYSILDYLKIKSKNKVKFFNLQTIPLEVIDNILTESNFSIFFH